MNNALASDSGGGEGARKLIRASDTESRLFNMLISVVIPVFNVADYLPACLDSIVSQANDADFEIVLVDDGSVDMSPFICDVYADEFEFIRVIHQANRGVSSARNRGMVEASGDYLMFVDGDDYVLPRCMERLSSIIKKHSPDVIYGGYQLFADEPILASSGDGVQVLSREDALVRLLHGRSIDCGPWANCIQRSCWEDISFPEGREYEDLATMHKPLMNAQKIVLLDAEIYAYRKRLGSAMRSEHVEMSRLRDYHQAILDVDNDFQGANANLRKAKDARVALELSRLISLIRERADVNDVSVEDLSIQARAELKELYPKVMSDISCPVSIKAKMILALFAPALIPSLRQAIAG